MSKNKQKRIIHKIPAGLIIGDNTTELFGCRETKKVYALSNGKTIPFEDISDTKKALLFEELLKDEVAINDLKHLPQNEAIEQFAFCMYGALDHKADFDLQEKLKSPENFLCSDNCKCLKWKSKNIVIEGNKLTPKEIEIISEFATDKPDKQIAKEVDITESTLNTHKKNLFEKFDVFSKTGLITKAITNQIIQ